jgi:ABC-type branched-subunit amino acid transport system ATPase component
MIHNLVDKSDNKYLLEAVKNIKKINREMDTTILIVEQKVREVFKISGMIYALRLGKIAFEGTPEKLNDEKLKEIFLI